MTNYYFTKTLDAVNFELLVTEIQTALSPLKIKKLVEADSVDGYMTFVNNGDANNLWLCFDSALSGSQETILNATIIAHIP